MLMEPRWSVRFKSVEGKRVMKVASAQTPEPQQMPLIDSIPITGSPSRQTAFD